MNIFSNKIKLDDTEYFISDHAYDNYKETILDLSNKKNVNIEDVKIQLGFLIEMETSDTNIQSKTFNFCLDLLKKDRGLKIKKQRKIKEPRERRESNFKVLPVFKLYGTAIKETLSFIRYNTIFYLIIHWLGLATVAFAALSYAMDFRPTPEETEGYVSVMKYGASIYFLFGILAPLLFNKQESNMDYDDWQVSKVYMMFMTIGFILTTILFYF